ncbi:MAG: carboxylating nicotinate-nucleotide diphosphorylase [Candidatus Diapherotrites archaeon]
MESGVPPFVRKRLLEFVESDIAYGDVTTAIVPEDECVAEVFAQRDCVLAGIEECLFLCWHYSLKAEAPFSDGSRVKPGTIVMRINGSNQPILQLERTLLNVLGRMSGVATACANAAEKAAGIRVAVTRKTFPGLNELDKKAAAIGGADPHRLNLSDMVLLKGNHLAFFGSVKEAVNAAKKKTSFSKKIEVETTSAKEAVEAAEAKADIIMLDNFSAEDAKKGIEGIRKKGNSIIELSGGISLENIEKYAALKPDVISLGAITKNAEWIDFSLKIKTVK